LCQEAAYAAETSNAASGPQQPQLRGYKSQPDTEINSIRDIFKEPKPGSTTAPPPVIPSPPAPPEDTRFSVDMRKPASIPDVSQLRSGIVKLDQINLSQLPILRAATGPLAPLRLEASYSEAVTLRQLLILAVDNNLPIKIAAAEQKSKKYDVLSSFGELLPTSATGYVRPHTWTLGSQISSPLFYQIVYMPVFKGGHDVFALLRARHESRAAAHFTNATINDQLLEVYLKYQDLILQRALLQIRIKAVEVARTQLQMNEDMKAAGEGTRFEVLQSRSQLLKDQQELLKSQVDLRHAAINLAACLNLSPTMNLIPDEHDVSVTTIINPAVSIFDLTKLAIERRPELRRYEELRLAARREVQVAAAELYPDASFFVANALASTHVRGGQTGTSASSSGVVIPAGNALAGGLINVGGTNASNVPWTNSFAAGFLLNWLLPGMGVPTAGRVLALKQQARKVMLQANQTFVDIMRDLHNSYLDVLNSRAEIPVAEEAVVTAAEELRNADVRHKYGVGTNLDVLQAQRDYISALTRQADALITYRKAQARLLHDSGTISIDTLTMRKTW
jgi:outer membrane protein TolC